MKIGIVFTLSLFFMVLTACSTYSKSEKTDCADYKPMCGLWGAYSKCTKTPEGCYQCECINNNGQPEYILPENQQHR